MVLASSNSRFMHEREVKKMRDVGTQMNQARASAAEPLTRKVPTIAIPTAQTLDATLPNTEATLLAEIYALLLTDIRQNKARRQQGQVTSLATADNQMTPRQSNSTAIPYDSRAPERDETKSN